MWNQIKKTDWNWSKTDSTAINRHDFTAIKFSQKWNVASCFNIQQDRLFPQVLFLCIHPCDSLCVTPRTYFSLLSLCWRASRLSEPTLKNMSFQWIIESCRFLAAHRCTTDSAVSPSLTPPLTPSLKPASVLRGLIEVGTCHAMLFSHLETFMAILLYYFQSVLIVLLVNSLMYLLTQRRRLGLLKDRHDLAQPHCSNWIINSWSDLTIVK